MDNVATILKQKYPDKLKIRFDVFQDDKRKTIFLSGFIVTFRSKGLGTEFMNTLTSLADQIGYKITLTPSNAYGGNVQRLKEFYRRFGFIFNKGDNRDYTHKEDMYRLPQGEIVSEDDMGSGDSGNATGAGKVWDSGVQRGKANPISNHGNWESGVVRGKGNPLTTMSENKLTEELNRLKKIMGIQEGYKYPNKTLMNIDIQPEYQQYISFKLYNWADMVNSHRGKIIFFYNGQNTHDMISEGDYITWLWEHAGISEEVLDRAVFFDKGYFFFRYCIDNKIEEKEIVDLVRFMYETDMNDSRDFDDGFWETFMKNHPTHKSIQELLQLSEDSIQIPELMDYLKQYDDIVICGGGVNECLKEVEIALQALNKPYTTYGDFIYENQS